MNSKAILAIVALAAAASTGVRAGEVDASNFEALKFEGTRTRAEVKAEAATVSATRSTEPAGSRVIASPTSGLDSKLVRAEAAEAVRLGQIPHGEIGYM